MISLSWEKSAFEKLARLGAIVFLPTTNGKYLLQSESQGLRPPGGGKEPEDSSLLDTIVREINEEFAIPEKTVRSEIKFLGYEYRRPEFWGNKVFEFKNHGLKPGTYQASNSPDEKVKLVEAGLDDPDYVGPDPDLLLTKEEKKDAEETAAETKSALTWDLFKEASDEDLHDLFKPDFTPEEMEDKAKSQHRLYHKMAPRLASMERWPKEWVRDQDPQGWVEWYDQYHSGRRSTDDGRQIRRWLNFKARHGASFKASPTPRRGWALINWAIDPLNLLPMEKRPNAQKAMDEYRDTVDGRYKSDGLRKAAAQTGLERPIENHRFVTYDELEAIGNNSPINSDLRLDVVSPNGDIQTLKEYINQFNEKESSHEGFHGITNYNCGHTSQCRCARPAGEKPPERTLDKSCPTCQWKKQAFSNVIDSGVSVNKPPQGVMSGQTIDSGAPVLVPPPPAAQESDSPSMSMVSDQEAGITGKEPDWGDRLKQLRERRGENPDGTLNRGVLEGDYFINEALKNASLFTESELRNHCRQGCIKQTGNANPTNEEVEKWADEELTRIYQDQEKNAEMGTIHERVVASGKEGKCPRCGVAEDMGTSVSASGQITCGACKEKSNYTEWGISKASSSVEMPGEVHDRNKNKSPEPALGQPVRIPDPRLPKPPRMGANATGDQLKPASATGDQGPALDIPASTTSAAHVKTPMAEHQPVQPVQSPFQPAIAKSIQEEQQAMMSPTLAGKSQPLGSGPSIADVAYPMGHMTPAISQGIGSLPMGVTAQNTPMLQQQRQHSQMNLAKTAMVTDSAGTPTTGPEAIYHALLNLDLEKKQAEAESVIKRKLKSKRPDAVKILGYIQGMKKSGIQPHELMISRVPVIPPQFRPFSVTGDTFVPGDANELYRDLINLVGVHGEIEGALGKAGSGKSRLNVYDAIKAVYGFGEPTSPKTRERVLGGFLTKVVGAGPKFSFPQSKMLAKDMDFTGNSVIGVDPDLGLDQIGIPNEMAWKLYAPYVQRRLVRSGMSPEQAVRHIADRHELASKHLDLEMKERPVVYGRQPSWHKYNVIGGWPKRIEGNMIRINPLVTTGMNADFDGDTLNVHLPSMPESVQDAKEKLMASKQLFSMKNRSKVMPLPKQEFVLGLYNAQRRTPRRVLQFPDDHTALAAIKKGDVALSDEVTIGRHKFTMNGAPIPLLTGLSKEDEDREALSELKP